jgi:DNA mismatch repair protein MutS
MNSKEVDFNQLTPMMQHYLTTKEEYPGCILFYRLGDFYEMFFEDAQTVSRELELTLTGKSCGLAERAPMCGIPYHAVDGYLTRLINKGYKVAVCEQVEDPKEAKGMVRREVTRIVTPGTNMDEMSLDESRNNYIMGIFFDGDRYGVSVADVTTADFFVTEVDSVRSCFDEISKYHPSELVCNEHLTISGLDLADLEERLHISLTELGSHYFDETLSTRQLLEHFHTNSLRSLGLEEFTTGSIAAGALLKYLYEIQKTSLEHMNHISPYRNGNFMLLDASTRRNLELVETLREKMKRGSLLWVLDKTKTAMGARMLRSDLEQPLTDPVAINDRLNAVEELQVRMVQREELREYLSPIYDLERLITRVIYQTANPRDLLAFKNSLKMLPGIRTVLDDFTADNLCRIRQQMDDLGDIYQWIDETICDEPPLSSRDGDIIRDGFDAQIDKLRKAKTDGKTWLAELETRERERTGIKNLKVKYNKVFGYYLEVTNSYKDLVPQDYQRKQTLANAERYFTPELKELEDTILGAEDKLISLEYEFFRELRTRIAAQVSRIQETAKAIARLDVYASLAYVAEKNHYCRPGINQKGIIDIKGGRHPVVEQMMDGHMFIDNDTYLDNKKQRMSIITGPNMAGKSTYMRQTALIVLMAQIGSFVPAKSANIGVVDRIFTRVGASDDLASGQSTFMVEMNEVANILHNATKNSLLILDEIGRGTSTFDGLSIAWAVVEYISNPKIIGAKTLFATHYHELTELEGKLEGVHNYCVAVREDGDSVIFLRKIVPGGADKSYGIAVAKLAGLPEEVIDRANRIVEQLCENDIVDVAKNIAVEGSVTGTTTRPKALDEVDLAQMSFLDTVKDDDIIDEIRQMDISHMTPIEAMNTLHELQVKVKNRW